MVGSVFPHGPAFRPTETKDWSRCPALWWYKHVEGWESPLAIWSPEMSMGTALHAGMAAYWLGLPDPVTHAVNTLTDLWPDDAPEEYVKDTHLELIQRVGGQLVRYLQREMESATPLMVEQPLGEDGHTTPDVVVREHGKVGVIDLKYHHKVAPEYIHYRFEHIDRDHQFNDYPWRVADKLGEPVAWFRKLGVIGQPKIVVRSEEFGITPEREAAWLQSARGKWHQMDLMKKSGPIAVYQRQEGCRPYGERRPCEFEAACWTCYGDRDAMTKFYTRRVS